MYCGPFIFHVFSFSCVLVVPNVSVSPVINVHDLVHSSTDANICLFMLGCFVSCGHGGAALMSLSFSLCGMSVNSFGVAMFCGLVYCKAIRVEVLMFSRRIESSSAPLSITPPSFPSLLSFSLALFLPSVRVVVAGVATT
jgi:hypothetical protein